MKHSTMVSLGKSNVLSIVLWYKKIDQYHRYDEVLREFTESFSICKRNAIGANCFQLENFEQQFFLLA